MSARKGVGWKVRRQEKAPVKGCGNGKGVNGKLRRWNDASVRKVSARKRIGGNVSRRKNVSIEKSFDRKGCRRANVSMVKVGVREVYWQESVLVEGGGEVR